MKKLTILGLLVLSSIGTAQAQELTASETAGKMVFDKWCEPCHGRVAGGLFGGLGAHALPGTSALMVKYKGDLPPVLEDRTDLAPVFVKAVVRGGLNGMPITRKTEISDAELDNVAAYLNRAR